MKKVYRLHEYSSFDGGDWCLLGRASRLVYMEEDAPKERVLTFDDFDAAYEYLEKNSLTWACRDTTAFRRKPMIRCWNHYGSDESHKMTKEKFKTFSERQIYEAVVDFTSQDLAELMSINDFIEFCKDHGLVVCPIKKNGQ